MKHTVTISWDDEENDEAPTWEEFLEVYILDEMHGYIDDLDMSDRTKNHAQDIVSKIIRHLNRYVENQKGVDAEPVRHGKWTDGKAKNIKTGEVRLVRKCSECESGYFIYDFLNSVDEIPRYCPNCGAKMDGEQEKQNEKT